MSGTSTIETVSGPELSPGTPQTEVGPTLAHAIMKSSHGHEMTAPSDNKGLWIAIVIVIIICYCACLCSSIISSFIGMGSRQ